MGLTAKISGVGATVSWQLPHLMRPSYPAWSVSLTQIPTTLSAAMVSSAKSAGVMNLAFFPSKSSSETPRACAQPPQTCMDTPLSIAFGKSSFNGGQPTPSICPTMVSFIK